MRAALILVSSLVLAACNMSADAQEGKAGPAVERSYNLTGFDGVSLSGPYKAVVTVGPQASIRASGPAEELEKMEVEVKKGQLEIRRKSENKLFGKDHRGQNVTIHITMPSMRAASIGGSGGIQIDRVEGPTFSASIGGSGDIEVQALKVEQGDFSVAGSGGIWAKGSAGNVRISIAGSGDVNLDAVESRTASVSIAGSGDVRTRANETAEVSIVGSGDVSVAGKAKCTVSKMGSGNVRCEG